MPIDALPMSERTRNALIKHWIRTVLDLVSIIDFSHGAKSILKANISISWIGWKWLAEITNAVEKHKLAKITIDSPNLPIVEEFLSYRNLDNLDYYIPIKKTWAGKPNLRDLWKKDINNYLLSCYNLENIISIQSLFSLILDTLSDIEKNIMTHRMSLLWSSSVMTLSQIAKDNGLTGERVRQLEKSITNKLSSLFLDIVHTSRGQTLIDSLANQFRILDHVCLVNISPMCTDLININMSLYLMKHLFSTKYAVYPLSSSIRWFTWITLFVSKDFLDQKSLEKIFNSIDRYFQKKRPEDKVITRDVFISQICWTTSSGLIDNPSYHKIFATYLSFICEISETPQWFLFPRNKKDRIYLVWKALGTIDEPIHYSDMAKLMKEKYPELDWSDTKVLSALTVAGKNVWEGLYVHQNHSMKWGLTLDLAHSYILSQWHPVHINELTDYIIKHRVIDKWSVHLWLFWSNKSKLLKLSGKMVGIQWVHDDISVLSWKTDRHKQNHAQIDPIVLSILTQNSAQEFTLNQLIEESRNRLGDDLPAYRVASSLKRLIGESKVSYFKKGIENYYYPIL